MLVGRKGQRSLIKRRIHLREGGAPRWGRGGVGGVGGAGAVRGRGRDVATLQEPQRAMGTARQLAKAEGEEERERVREAARE